MKYFILILTITLSILASEADSSRISTELALNMPAIEASTETTVKKTPISVVVVEEVSQKIMVFDSGIANMESQDVWVEFSEEFKASFGEATPIVTLTPIGRTAKLHIKEITDQGFRAGCAPGDSFDFDFTWISVAK